MLKMKTCGTVVEVEAEGTLQDLLNEYSRMTSSLAHNFLQPCNTESEYDRVAGMMLSAFCTGMKRATDRRREEVSHESTE